MRTTREGFTVLDCQPGANWKIADWLAFCLMQTGSHPVSMASRRPVLFLSAACPVSASVFNLDLIFLFLAKVKKKDRNLFTCIVKIESFLFLSLSRRLRRWSRFHSWKKIFRRRRSCFEIRFRCYVRRKLLQNIFFLFSFVDYAPTVWKKKKKWRVKT